MPKKLMLMRHAKSSWNQPGLDDHDRPLNDRGRRDAPKMGMFLGEECLLPDLIVSSTALRAMATAEALAEASGYEGQILFDRSLYLATPEAYLDVAAALPDETGCAMLVGHNPGLEELVELLTSSGETMPTAGLALIELPIKSWVELARPVRGKLIDFWRPREI